MITVYISIGNSDDKLTQQEWATFYRSVNLTIREYLTVVHGQWVSEPASAWQNACWCIEIIDRHAEELKSRLRECAAQYRQDSIAWAEVAITKFLIP